MNLYDGNGNIINASGDDTSLAGKQIIWLGDSVIDYEEPDGINVADMFATMTGAVCHNWAQGGTCFAKGKATNYDPYSFVGMVDALVEQYFTYQNTYAESRGFEDRVADMEAYNMSNAEYCIIGFGTNDFWGNMTWKNDSNEFDVNTSYGAIKYGLKTLMTAYPELKILMLGLQELGEVYVEAAAWYNATGTHYNSGDKYDEFITEICNEYAVPRLPIQEWSRFNSYTNSTYTNGVPHLTHKGKERYCVLIRNALKLYY